VPRDVWHCRRPPGWRGGVWSLRTRGSAGALLGGGAGSGALGHVTMPEPSLSREAGSRVVVARGSAWAHALPIVLA
jgi:hypothetical protein